MSEAEFKQAQDYFLLHERIRRLLIAEYASAEIDAAKARLDAMSLELTDAQWAIVNEMILRKAGCGMDEFDRIKAALEARGFLHRAGTTEHELELFREVDGEREAIRVVKLGKADDARASWVVDTWDRRRREATPRAAFHAVEAAYRADAAKALRRADELAELGFEVERARLARTNAYGAACMRLQRRIQAGESGAAIDAESARLDTEWLTMTDEERARLVGS